MIKRKSFNLLVAILFVLLLAVGFVSAITGSIGNAKMVLYPEVNGFTTTKIEKSILVKNVNDEPINVTLQIDKETEKFIELKDKAFTLQPDEQKNAAFIVKVRSEGTYDGKIIVFFASLNEDSKAGVALSSQITVIARKDQGTSGTNEGNIRNNEDEEENTNNESTNTGNVITDEMAGQSKKSISGLTILAISLLVLIVILVILIVLMSKRKSKKNGGKRRGKLNGKKRKRS